MKSGEGKKDLIFLTGFMGSGKSTIGAILANTIGYQFVDLDLFIEQSTDMKISEIFREKGEAHFRALEQKIIQELVQGSRVVISLGGGTTTHRPTLDLIKSSGILVYLKADTEHLLRRLRSKTGRPLLKDEQGNLLDVEHLQQRIEEMVEKRKEYYEQAQLIVHTDDKKIGFTVDELAKKLRHYVTF